MAYLSSWLPTCSLLPCLGCIQVSRQDLLSFIGHFLPFPTYTVLIPFFSSLLFFSHWAEIEFWAGQRKRWLWLRKTRDSLGGRELEIVLHLFTSTSSAPLSLCVLISVFHCLLTLLSVSHFHLLPVPLVFLVSLFTTVIPITTLRILPAAHLISYTTSHRLAASVSLSLANSDVSCLCPSVPTQLCGHSPCNRLSVSWFTEGSQSLQYKHETISKWLAGWLWTVETNLHISLSQARSTGLPVNHMRLVTLTHCSDSVCLQQLLCVQYNPK